MKRKTARRVLLVPAVVLIGLVVMAALIVSRRPPEQVERTSNGALVDVFEAHRTDREVIVSGHGTVEALDEVQLIPQVTGRVESVHPEFVAGGSFAEGEELLRIEQDDYRLRVQQALAQVAQAQYQLEVAEANAEIAREEWELVNENRRRTGGDELAREPDALVLHRPQLRQARAALQSAQASLEQAKLNLARTVLRAPFNCRVANETVSPGQLVGPGGPVARLYSTDVAEIEVPLASSELTYIEIPGARADVTLPASNDTTVFTGYVHRLVGVIGEVGRLSRVVVRIDRPFETSASNASPLQLGAFVDVRIHGKTARDVTPVPRAALREHDNVWIAESDTLAIRRAEVYYRSEHEVLIRDGVEEGDLVVLTPISGAAEGMRLRTRVPGESGR
ncbi:MAG: Efflux pump periplasmic linker BepF [Calditrichaeota bacterium]|nr:Efflux pump periplasmic linker BepF [Calditrichota bacterium]